MTAIFPYIPFHLLQWFRVPSFDQAFLMSINILVIFFHIFFNFLHIFLYFFSYVSIYYYTNDFLYQTQQENFSFDFLQHCCTLLGQSGFLMLSPSNIHQRTGSCFDRNVLA